MTFYWINCTNMVEAGGPFNSIAEAKNDAVKTYKKIGDIARAVVIVRAVEVGEVALEPNARWVPEKNIART